MDDNDPYVVLQAVQHARGIHNEKRIIPFSARAAAIIFARLPKADREMVLRRVRFQLSIEDKNIYGGKGVIEYFANGDYSTLPSSFKQIIEMGVVEDESGRKGFSFELLMPVCQLQVILGDLSGGQ